MNIIGRFKIWFIFSGILILISVLAIVFWGLKPGIDFVGGTILEVDFPQTKERKTAEIKEALKDLNLENLTSTPTGQGSVILKFKPVEQEKKGEIIKKLQEKIGETQELRFETVGPTIGRDLTKKAIIAVILASLTIILYLAYSFRGVPKPASSWAFGVNAVVALIHDITITTGTFTVLSRFFGWEIDSLFIVALLTILGFSVHDTIVVFDRIRENLRQQPDLLIEQNANQSINQTIARSLNTSLTLILVLLALLLLGGSSLRPFIATLLTGVTIGTYSSIFIASPLLVLWTKRGMNRLTEKRANLSH